MAWGLGSSSWSYALAENVIAKVHIQPQNTVCLWLGVNFKFYLFMFLFQIEKAVVSSVVWLYSGINYGDDLSIVLST